MPCPSAYITFQSSQPISIQFFLLTVAARILFSAGPLHELELHVIPPPPGPEPQMQTTMLISAHSVGLWPSEAEAPQLRKSKYIYFFFFWLKET
jgi:hypothetical protein